MTQPKFTIIPSENYTPLLKCLLRGYVDEEFKNLSSAIAATLGNEYCHDTERFNRQLFDIVQKVYLDNIFILTRDSDSMTFMSVLMHNQFVSNITIRLKYLDEFIREWNVLIDDVETVECSVTMSILNWMRYHYNLNSSEINTCVLNLQGDYLRLINPRYVNTFRFEFTPDLRPMLIYTDVLNEAVPV